MNHSRSIDWIRVIRYSGLFWLWDSLVQWRFILQLARSSSFFLFRLSCLHFWPVGGGKNDWLFHGADWFCFSLGLGSASDIDICLHRESRISVDDWLFVYFDRTANITAMIL